MSSLSSTLRKPTRAAAAILRAAALSALAFGGKISAQPPGSAPDSPIQVGHWVEIVGDLVGTNRFSAREIKITQPAEYETLIGRIQLQDNSTFLVLGQPVQLSANTTLHTSWAIESGQRLLVNGRYRGPGQFDAAEVAYRQMGQDRIVGRVDERLSVSSEKYELIVMRYTVEVPDHATISHALPLDQIALSPPRLPEAIAPNNTDDEYLFGEGFRLGKHARLSFQLESRLSSGGNLNLDDEIDDAQSEHRGTFGTKLTIAPSDRLYAVVHVSTGRRDRELFGRGRSTRRATGLKQAYVFVNDIAGSAVDIQVGRQRIDDEREWLYDGELDGVRLLVDGARVRFEGSVTKDLNTNDERERAATNLIAYLSNSSRNTHVAAYMVQREFDLMEQERTLHVGFRAIGNWTRRNRGWLDIAWAEHEDSLTRTEGWGLDLGNTWMPSRTGISFTMGYAMGQGGAAENGVEPTFRQTGLEGNSAAFSGVTSFSYYGEVLDPELSNLQILTAGLGYVSDNNRFSIDLVGHRYLQVDPRPALVNAALRRDPTGLSDDIGSEVDVIFGWRNRKHWIVKAIAGYFRPGRAFDVADSSFWMQLQARFRY